MAGKRDKKGSKGTIVVKKYEINQGDHHGGAWKVAYADFVTAMMAFFLLMWLLNATTEDQRKGLADYFSPSNLMSHASSGTGEPFGGHTAFDHGALVSDRGTVNITPGKRPVTENTSDGEYPIDTATHRDRIGEDVGQGPIADDQDADATGEKPFGQKGARPAPGAYDLANGGPGAGPNAGANAGPNAGANAGANAGPNAGLAGGSDVIRDGQPDARPITPADVAAEKAREEKAAFENAAQQIKDAVRNDPALVDIIKQLSIDMTPEGLRIQIVDDVKLAMFPTGSATPNDRARLLIQKVAPVLMKLTQPISIAGHTDAAPYPGPSRTNWELSTERANATRRLLVDSGLPEPRIRSVTGHADRDPLLPADPLAAANRRIAIVVLREAPVVATEAPSEGSAAAPVGPSPGPSPGASLGAPAGPAPDIPARAKP